MIESICFGSETKFFGYWANTEIFVGERARACVRSWSTVRRTSLLKYRVTLVQSAAEVRALCGYEYYDAVIDDDDDYERLDNIIYCIVFMYKTNNK